MSGARIRLALLWLSQAARVLADNCLRLFVVLQVGQSLDGSLDAAAFHLVTAFFIAPFILLAPVNGPLSNGLPRRWVLAGASAFCLGVALVFGALDGPWLVCMTLIGIGAAIYSPTRYALLPAASQDTGMPLARVNGWIEMGGSAGIVVGMLLGIALHRVFWHGLPAAVAVAAAASLVSLLAALPVQFAADVRRPEAPAEAVAGFFRDTRRVLAEPEARGTLLGLASFLALITAGAGAVITYIQGLGLEDARGSLIHAMIQVSVGAALGAVLAGVAGHPTRSRGLVPLGATGLLVVLAWAAAGSDLGWPCLLLGFLGGLVNVPLRAAYQAAVPADARGNGMAVLNTAVYVFSAALALLLVALVRLDVLPTGASQLWFLTLIAAAGAAVSWWVLNRDVFELGVEIAIWPMYRIRAYGPGLAQFPRGPVLVLANHTAYLDPIWLAKILPRRLTPMMTSTFFDLPVLHFIMTRIVHAIRVESSAFRREAPELDEAVAALDRGELVLVFPEGWVRRRPGPVVRQFGQGIWHILRQRPQTPVIACWIEGGWGSYSSFCNGPPTVNKSMDWWWPINVALSEPHFLDVSVLSEQRATRSYLMHLCLDTRRHLGLDAGEVPESSDEEQDDRVRR